ncbi:MAG: efflux RND transporter permease subunit [Rhodothermales bacterium]
MNLTQASIRRPVTTIMVFVSLVLIGVISTRLIPLELFPSLDLPFIVVNIPYPGSTPEEVERQITRPAEEVIATVSGIKEMNSDSQENMAQIVLLFDWGEDTDLKAIEIREKIDGIRDQLPADIERIFVGQFSTSDEPILQLRISSERDLSGAYELLDRKLKRAIERVDGVSKVDLYGVNPREVRIELIADRVAAHRINLNQLVASLQRTNFSVTAGRITDGNRRFVVRPSGELTKVEQVENLIVASGVRLRDVAHIIYDDPEMDHGRHLDGAYAIGMDISKEGGANTVEVARRIFAELARLDDDPEMQGITLYPMDDSAEGITSSLRDLLEAGLLGGLFALLVLFFFLRRASTTMIVTLAVPISILVTIGALYFLGLSLNILSMMGLMLAVGMLVDNAVVVVESIHRHQHLSPSDPLGATRKGVKEVALAVTAGTLTTAIVFLPMIVSQADQVTLFLKHVSVAICVALGISLLISLTIVPLLTARLKPPKPKPGTNLIERVIDRYGRLLDWLLHHRKTSFWMVVGVLFSVAIPAALVDQDFFPDERDEREMRLFFRINDLYTLERVEEGVDKIEAYLFANKEQFEIESVYTFYQANFASSTILLTKDGKTDVEDLEEMILAEMPKIAIGDPAFTWQRPGGLESMRVTLSGESSQQLSEYAEEVERILSRVEGFKNVQSEATLGDREIHVVVDRDRARQYGFSTQQVATTVAAAMRGQNLRRFRTPDGEVQVRLKFQDLDRQTLDHLRNLPLLRTGNDQIKLASMADFRVRRGPRAIHRENRITMIGVTAQLDDITTDEARQKIERVLSNFELPKGYAWGFGQRFRQAEESQNIMMINLLLALALIYLVMAALFESLMHPLAIWTSIIFAIVGVFWFFLITQTTLSIMAWIGILILIGVVVNNGIVLIDHINNLRAEGLPRHEAIVQAGRERLRPIVMTAATTVLGLIPLAIGTTQIGGDGPHYFPMARAIVGGLLFSTLVTLIILPSIYVMLDDIRAWSKRIVQAATR